MQFEAKISRRELNDMSFRAIYRELNYFNEWLLERRGNILNDV